MSMPRSLLNAIWAAFVAVAIAGIYCVINYSKTKKRKEGTEEMQDLAKKIRDGSKTFMKKLFLWITIAAVVLAIALGIIIQWQVIFCVIFGFILTSLVAVVGMSIALFANVRSAAKALECISEYEDLTALPEKEQEKIFRKAKAETANTIIQASQVSGIAVEAAGIFGFAVVLLVSGWDAFFNLSGRTIIPIVGNLTGFSLGWSVVAMFARIPGGIFTKAADIGADLIGKVWMHFDEDDIRNPAVIADFIGDNVNDTMANMTDLGESFVATPVTVFIAATLSFANVDNHAVLIATVVYPFFLMLGGLVGSIIGLWYASHAREAKDPNKRINASLFIAAGSALLSGLVGAILVFKNTGNVPDSFKLGWSSAFICALCGIAAGVIIGFVVKHFTDLESGSTKLVAHRARYGASLCMSEAQIVGWISCIAEIIPVAVTSWIAFRIAGIYGTSTMALGMMSFIAQPIAADAFGPIADNAGGIAESAHLPKPVREKITDPMDSFGNSSAAVGKGFAIGSAEAVVVSQTMNFGKAAGIDVVNLLSGDVMLGLLLGCGLMALFCGLLWKYTIQAAELMAHECAAQLSGKKPLSHAECIKIATVNAIKRMLPPVLIAFGSVAVIGFVFGPETLAGTLAGVSVVGVMLAIYFSNAGSVADNAKKRYEGGLEEDEATGFVKDSKEYVAAHDATVHGDTVGDGQKDVVATACDIFMKIMGTVSTMLAPLFKMYRLIPA